MGSEIPMAPPGPLDPETAHLVAALQLTPHPEGGFYRETYRSSGRVSTPRGDRAAMTAIRFLLPAGAISSFHRVLSDELWAHAGGDSLELHVIAPDGHHEVVAVGSGTDGGATHAVVPAGHWQAAR